MLNLLLLPIVLFLPGFLVTRLMGQQGDIVDTSALSVSFSFILLVLVGLFLHVFSAITMVALWLVYGLIIAFLTAALIIRR